MRNAFAAIMTELADQDPRIVLLSGDIGNRLFNTYKAKFPSRFYNCGVAEANMTSLAAGLAMSGLKPVTYTIASFNTIRCLEQIKIDLCYHDLPVVVVGTGAGLSYARLGATHHSLEDIAQMRTLPGMTVLCPGDAQEVRAALRAAIGYGHPCYVRLGKKGEPVFHSSEPELVIGRAIVLQQGEEVALLSAGNVLPVAVEAGKRLAAEGVSTLVASFHTIKPLDEELLAGLFGRFRVVATLEEHSRLGGFGSAVGEWLLGRPRSTTCFEILATPDCYPHEAGGQSYLREAYGLTTEAVCQRIRQALSGEPSPPPMTQGHQPKEPKKR